MRDRALTIDKVRERMWARCSDAAVVMSEHNLLSLWSQLRARVGDTVKANVRRWVTKR